jgi:type I restriction enzyme, S subunit
VTPNGFNFSSCQFIGVEKDLALRKGRLSRGDVVMTTRGTVGNVAYFDMSVPFPTVRINSGMVIFRTDPNKLSPAFLYHFLRSSNFQDQALSLRSGTAQPQLPIRDMLSIQIPLPDIATQNGIASILSAYDDLIENNTHRIQILEEMAQAIYREWFVEFRFPGHEGVRMVKSELGSIPEDWSVGTLADLIILQRGFDLPRQKRAGGSIPVVAATGILGTHSTAAVRGPGVVTGRSGSLGKVLYLSSDFWPLNTTLWVKEFRAATPELAYFTLKEMGLEQFNSGAAVPTLNRNDIAGFPVPIPPTDLVNGFTRFARSTFQLTRNLSRSLHVLRQSRDLLLPRLISGEIDVSDLDIVKAVPAA